MPTATEYRQRIANLLGAFPLGNNPTAYPNAQAAGGTVGFSSQKIDDCVVDVAADIIAAIASNPTHPRRRDLETTVTVTNGQLIPAHAGPLGTVLVEGVPGRMTAAEEITRLLANVLGLPTTGYFAIRGDRIFYVGITATVDLVVIPSPVDPATVPAEYAECLVTMAMAVLLPLAGDTEKVQAAQHYMQIAGAMRQAIAANQTPPIAPEMVGV
jgi:hypothetical protein